MRPAVTWVAVAGAILLFGLVRLPIERSLAASHQTAHLRTTKLDLGLREQIGQLSFVAALSGFRSLVAAFLWIEAHTAWEQTAWGRMAGLFESVTTLQPRCSRSCAARVGDASTHSPRHPRHLSMNQVLLSSFGALAPTSR